MLNRILRDSAPVQAEALAAGPLQVFHKKNCNCEVTEHYISKISEEET